MVAETKVRELLEEKFRAGFDAGQKSLGEQLLQQRKQLLEIQTGVLRSIEQTLPKLIDECERSLVLLAIETAQRFIQSIPISTEMIEGSIRQALAELQQTTEYQLHLHPADLAMLQAVHSGILPDPGNPHVKFRANESVTRGGCFIQTEHGAIDATREKMFEKLKSVVVC